MNNTVPSLIDIARQESFVLFDNCVSHSDFTKLDYYNKRIESVSLSDIHECINQQKDFYWFLFESNIFTTNKVKEEYKNLRTIFSERMKYYEKVFKFLKISKNFVY